MPCRQTRTHVEYTVVTNAESSLAVLAQVQWLEFDSSNMGARTPIATTIFCYRRIVWRVSLLVSRKSKQEFALNFWKASLIASKWYQSARRYTGSLWSPSLSTGSEFMMRFIRNLQQEPEMNGTAVFTLLCWNMNKLTDRSISLITRSGRELCKCES
jgi:hypothetical protein